LSIIQEVQARKILDSRGKDTIEVKIRTNDGIEVYDSVPSGTSTGEHEAILIDPQKAVEKINLQIAPKVVGKDCLKQKEIDELMIELDGTQNKANLGANSILGVSLAVARAGAICSKMPLFWYINHLIRKISAVEIEPAMPTPMMVMICGGKHANSPSGENLCIQEFSVIAKVEQGIKIWEEIKRQLKNKGIKYAIGLEGAFSPDLKFDEEAIEMVQEAIEKLGLDDTRLALDVAGNNCQISNENMLKIINKYNIYSVEDPFREGDWEKFGQLKLELDQQGRDYLLIGDDLFATHKDLLQKGINDLVANGIIIKVNQIGTLTEALEVITLAKKANYKCIVSHRSGETSDTFIADLAVGCAAPFLKSGAPIPKERKLKYDRLKEIEGEL
jgi:enolase